MPKCLVVHQHEAGETPYHIVTDDDFDLPSECANLWARSNIDVSAFLAQKLGILYEPQKGESILVIPNDREQTIYLSREDWERDLEETRE